MISDNLTPIKVVNKMTIYAGELPYGGKIDNLLTVSTVSPIIGPVLMA